MIRGNELIQEIDYSYSAVAICLQKFWDTIGFKAWVTRVHEATTIRSSPDVDNQIRRGMTNRPIKTRSFVTIRATGRWTSLPYYSTVLALKW